MIEVGRVELRTKHTQHTDRNAIEIQRNMYFLRILSTGIDFRDEICRWFWVSIHIYRFN